MKIKNKNKSKNSLKTRITFATTILANVVIVALMLLSIRYSGVDIKVFAGVYGAIICLLLILDICFFVGYNYRDSLIKKIAFFISVVLLIVGTVGSFYLYKLNSSVSNIIDNSGVDQYEIIRGSVVAYDDSGIENIKDLKGKKVGIVGATGVGVTSVSKEKFEAENVEPIYVDYSSVNELFVALIQEEVDAACMQSGYKTMFASEDGYEEYLDRIIDVYTFEEKVKTSENESANLDVSSEPFSVLLIGYAPEAGGGGLADTIILASVNPKSMAVTMTSVARDTYTTISCTGGKAKINSARAQSRACLMETVGDLLDTKVDFYAEINFLGLVDIIDALGGIYIDSPVEFVGQTPSSTRGEYTVWVPKGPYRANGEQALAFARERHAMPNGDLDRQVHQQEVIKEMVRELINLRDVNKALDIMEAAGENFSTNLSISQITNVFNYIMNAPNYTSIGTFNLIDMITMRVTGYASWYYDYPMRLPQWIYKAYMGSIKENKEMLDKTLGEFDKLEQTYLYTFNSYFPYLRHTYSTIFDEPHIQEEMPDYYPYLTKMTYSEVIAWAAERGIKLNVTSINEGDVGYDPNNVGAVLAQEPRYGALVSEWPTASITVMGTPLKDEDRVPDFTNKPISEVTKWAKNNGYKVEIEWQENTDNKLAGLVYYQDLKAGIDKRLQSNIKVAVYNYPLVDTTKLVVGMSFENLKTWINENLLVTPTYKYVVDPSKEEGSLVSYTHDAEAKPRTNNEFVFTVTTKVCPDGSHTWGSEQLNRVEPTLESEGSYEKKCSLCGTIEVVVLPKLEPTPPPSTPDDSTDNTETGTGEGNEPQPGEGSE